MSIKEFEHLRLPLEAIKSATNNFDDAKLLGAGGFGKVYKGVLSDQTTVAVKRLDRKLYQGETEFWKEVMMLSRCRHENLVSLVGFSSDDAGEKILVYEYVGRGSLDKYLSNAGLTWIQRLKICIGAARGLEYLHDPKGTQQRVIHRDIKSSNILVDDLWNAKISDFGFSKLGPANQQYTFQISNVAGTIGYCDPLYFETGLLTKESDVYSFGVVLFEVLCGRPCTVNAYDYDDHRRLLPHLVKQCYDERKEFDTIIPDGLKTQIKPRCLDRFSAIAYRCLQRNHKDRPSMSEIVKELEAALQHQEGEERTLSADLFTFEEVSRHNRINDCWLIISGKVYDVTNFVDHPGGEQVLVAATGKDATVDFEDVGHSTLAREMLERDYYKGKIDLRTVPRREPFKPASKTAKFRNLFKF